MDNFSNTENITSNSTTVVIKQVFLTIDPSVYVRWDDLFSICLYTIAFYYLIRLCVHSTNRRGLQRKKAEAVIINADDSVRVINVASD